MMNLKCVILNIVTVKFCLALSQTEIRNSVSSNCVVVRDAFAMASSEFIKCSIENSRPITFCVGCVTQYINILNSYNNMSQVTNNGTPCINSFINVDRLGIIHSLYENSENLWNRAKCYECFAIENGKLVPNISDKTITFGKLYSNFNDCLSGYENNGVCLNCMSKYVLLQDYFLGISNENEKIGVCMDIVDLMNTTWTYWGDTCCKFRRHNEVMFITSAIVVLVATVLFYIAAQVYSKKKLPTIMEQTRFVDTLDT